MAFSRNTGSKTITKTMNAFCEKVSVTIIKKGVHSFDHIFVTSEVVPSGEFLQDSKKIKIRGSKVRIVGKMIKFFETTPSSCSVLCE